MKSRNRIDGYHDISSHDYEGGLVKSKKLGRRYMAISHKKNCIFEDSNSPNVTYHTKSLQLTWPP